MKSLFVSTLESNKNDLQNHFQLNDELSQLVTGGSDGCKITTVYCPNGGLSEIKLDPA